MSITVELDRHLDVPGMDAMNAMTEIVNGLANRRPPYDRPALAFGIEVAGPLRITPSMPIGVEAELRADSYECVIEIAGREEPDLFPRFRGTLSISPLRDSGCELWLQGSYDVPLGPIGEAVDATLLHGAARRSLARFVDWMAEEIARLVLPTNPAAMILSDD